MVAAARALTLRLGSADAGVKHRGFSLEGEYYWRAINHLRGPNTDTLPNLWDHGFQLQASGMAVPKRLQIYASHSKVFGQYGDPSDTRVGANWFPFGSQTIRWNIEYLKLDRSPVGGLSLPYPVGGHGYVVYTTFEVNF